MDSKPKPPPPPPKPPVTQWLLGALFASLLLFVANRRSNEYILCAPSGIYTVEATRERVECLHIKGDTIADWGTLHEIQANRENTNPWIPLPLRKYLSQVKVVELADGEIVVPGLTDAHAHVLEYGYMMQLPLAEATSVQDVAERIKSYLHAHPDMLADKDRWIEGMGWDQTKWPEKSFPTAADLAFDPLLKDRLISLRRVDGHATWVSQRVLDLMGDLPDKVDGGIIVHENGKPTGIFIDNAISLIPIPPWSDAQMEEFFETSMKEVLSRGLTSIHDAASSPEMIAFMKKKAEEGNLPIRLYMMGNVDNSTEYWGHQIPRLINHGKHGRLTVRSIKLFTDGALGSWGAALLAPYTDNPTTHGIMRIEPTQLRKLVRQFYKDGWQVNIHCIGDRANRAVLDIYEEILTKDGANASEWRPRIEHAQIIEMGDLERVGRLGVIPSVQPTHATSDMWYAETRLGPERIKGAYAYQTLLRNSHTHTLPLGSDFPVESTNPLLGFYASTSRLSPSGTSPHGPGGWFPLEKLTREQALKGMTLDAAYASFNENVVGSLRPGKRADYVVLDRDIMRVEMREVLGARVRATVVDGGVVFGEL